MNSTLKGWVANPNTQGTFDIIQSSVLTIFFCTWTCLHLNVPAVNEGALVPILRKFRWMVLTILAPEFVTVLAAGQRADAKRVRDELHELGYSQWTLRQSFYANMGGFILCPRDSTPFPIHGFHLVYLVEKDYMTLPSMTSDEIADKSKAFLHQSPCLSSDRLVRLTMLWTVSPTSSADLLRACHHWLCMVHMGHVCTMAQQASRCCGSYSAEYQSQHGGNIAQCRP